VSIQEARLVDKENGREPEGPGWFVLNVRDAVWWRHEKFGMSAGFEGEGDAEFKQYGINLHVVWPGQPNCMYHGEGDQEDFLVLQGECLLLVEGEERRLGPWDFVHCPPWTEHVFVGAGEGPCVILMVGARTPDSGLRYPAAEFAQKHGAAVEQETTKGSEAYAPFGRFAPGRVDDPVLPWN
jgi:uncharacterized cupin superfamily protein